jgi:hypothetical protein
MIQNVLQKPAKLPFWSDFMEEFNKELCDERHEVITLSFDRIFKKFDGITTLLITTLLSTVGTLILVILKIITGN